MSSPAPSSERAFSFDSYRRRPSVDNEINGVHRPGISPAKGRSYLTPPPHDELHDLICIGFGPASLAIAIALHDGLEGVDTSLDLSGLRGRAPKVAFLEKQDRFAWHPGMLIEGARMQITFIKDMATLRNPRSQFTFLNYLHEKDRLVAFTNLDTFLPQRAEFEDYLQWCAGSFIDVVSYGEEVLAVEPCDWSKSYNLPVRSWIVSSRNRRTGQISFRRTRNVVVAVGGQPSFPLPFQKHRLVVHSSQYTRKISTIFPDSKRPYNIAVIGGGQSAAEIFDDLQSRYPNANTDLITKNAALTPSDDSPLYVIPNS